MRGKLTLIGPDLPDDIQTTSISTDLADLLHEGFYLVMLIRNGMHVTSAKSFSERLANYLLEFERRAKAGGHPTNDVVDAKYAFSALLDETVLTYERGIRDEWERCPLQLTLFGDQLAGVHFFDRLEKARNAGRERVGVIEVFYICILLGFKGRYRIEQPERLEYLSTQLGSELLHLKGKPDGFAPHWKPTGGAINRIQRQTPTWVIGSVLALAGLLAFTGLRWHLDRTSAEALEQYTGIIRQAERLPSITITLP